MRYCHPTNSANSGWTRSFLMIMVLSVFASWPALAQAPGSAQGEQSSVSSEGLVTLAAHTPSQVLDGTAILISPYNSQQKLRLALAVQPPHIAEEEEFIKELETKGSPNFHQFLSNEEWNARFAPSAEDEQKVVDWATSQGLTVTNRFANRLLVDVEAPVGVIERAFSVSINNYQVGSEVDFANDRDPVLPSSLDGIVYSVVGLNSIDRLHGGMPEARKAKGPDYVPGSVYAEGVSSHGDGNSNMGPVAVHDAVSAGLPSPRPGFTNGYADPGDIFTSEAYNWDGLERFSHCCNAHNDSTGSPAVSSIALATYAGFNQSDVNTFFTTYGFAWNYTAYNIDGTGTPPSECVVGTTGCPSVKVDDEATLDTEYSTAASNSYGSYLDTAHVYIYEGANNFVSTFLDLYNFMLSDGHAKVMSTSWSGAEVTSGTLYTLYEVPAHAVFDNMTGTGWTLIGDADDQGTTGDCATVSVNFPASDNNFVAAGGTALMLYSNGDWDYENAWTGGTAAGSCANNNGGGGGGISKLWSQPSWQSRYPAVAALGGTRLEPDLALNAGGIGQNYYYNGKLSPVGGTSIVAPELAGFFAQENTYLNYIGPICGSGTSNCTPVGNPNPFMYYDGGSGAPHNPFYDITAGCTSNDITAKNGLTPWCAGTGFDLATGWGSANMMQLAWGINWELLPADGNPSVAFTGPATSTWYNSNQQVDWTLSDTASNGFPAPGVAGFTQGWDSIPADPQSEAHGGSGNSFYSGPEYAFNTNGCLSFVAGSCSGGVSQGCHTVHVEGWDNEGRTAFGTYGPLCYDTIAPVTTDSVSGTKVGSYYENSATVTLTASDAGTTSTPHTGSGVSHIYYSINGALFVTYSAPFAVRTNGANTVLFYSTDRAGNAEGTQLITFGVTDTTTTSFKPSLNPIGLGEAVTFTADVTPASGVATGNVTFKDGATVLGTAALSGGVAKFTTSALAVGNHSITADFLGSTYFVASTSVAQTEVVKNDSTTVVASSANPSEYGEAVTLTATVKHTATATPTGTITFKNGATVLAAVAVAGGTAKYSSAAFAVGTHSITAVYSGDSNYVGSTSTPLSQVVDKTATSTTVVSSLNPSISGNSVTFTATVTAKAPGAGTPTGTVVFKNGSTTLGTGTLNSSRQATFAISTLAEGTQSITAVYDGNANFSISTSAVLSQKVNP
jgi:Pro-kumamolisin, activation domain/Bacterial Ig-like domain (group 3)